VTSPAAHADRLLVLVATSGAASRTTIASTAANPTTPTSTATSPEGPR